MTELSALERHRSGIVCVLVDPSFHGAGRIVRGAFGKHGVRYLAVMRRAMSGSWVAMVGRVRREPARVVGCRPGAVEVAVEAAFEMARHLAVNSTWVVNLPAGHQAAVLALLTARSETVWPTQ